MTSFLSTLLLIAAGFVALAVGGILLFAPEVLFEMSNVVLGDNPDLLSEIRAPGGLLLASGGFVFLAAFVARFKTAALALGAMLYLSYGLARLFSIAVDGAPGPSLQQATMLELVLGVLCLIALLARSQSTKTVEI